MSFKISSNTIGNRTRHLSACSEVRNQWYHRVPPAFLIFPYIAPFLSSLSCQMYIHTVHDFYVSYFIELRLVKFMICRGSNEQVVLNDAFARTQKWLILSRRSAFVYMRVFKYRLNFTNSGQALTLAVSLRLLIVDHRV